MQPNSTKTYPIADKQLCELGDGIDTIKRSLLAISNAVCSAESGEQVLQMEDVSQLLAMLENPVDQLEEQITAIMAQ